jgi:phospholipid/cholesterol/gamma-HCH transport system ATP-binding protein
MIEFKNVSFGYDQRLVLKNVSFLIDQSESVVVMGSSGSGKSTILRLILGLETPLEGEVLVDEQNICCVTPKEQQEIRKKIGMVFQDGALFDSLTVGENVGYYLIENTKMPYDEIEVQVRAMLGFIGLDADEIIDRLPDQLSGGMQRRVAIARALLSTDPKIMLYDEPTTGLDPQSSEMVLNLITKLQQDKAISSIIVTHEIADAFAIVNRFILLHKGEIVFDGNLDELRDSADPVVRDFLAPFRESMANVVNKRFVVAS